jgi:hypothetical protein
MIRFFLRLIGLLFLAAAFLAVVYDGVKSIADQVVFITKAGDVWNSIHATSQPVVQGWLAGRKVPWLWDPVLLAVLNAPIWALFLVVGAFFILIGRKRRPLIGYARS